MEHREYRVELDVYNGPLDLLLYLLKRDEVDIYDIPITQILDSYMHYVEMLKDFSQKSGLDINVAGDFLVMAATLMEIKSAMLLPKVKPDEGKEGRSAAQDLADPRYELVQQLLEYKRFKDTAVLLDRKQSEHQDRFARYPAKRDTTDDEPPPVDMDEVQVWDLLSAFSKLMSDIGQRKPKVHEVNYDDTPIELHAADIEDRLTREGKLTLKQLVVGRTNKSEIIGVFLALLELIRQKKILVTQTDDLTDLEIDPAPEEHRRTYEHASLSLSESAAETRDDGGSELRTEERPESEEGPHGEEGPRSEDDALPSAGTARDGEGEGSV